MAIDSNLILISIYLFLQMAIGLWVSRSIKSETDFLLGGRNLGMFLSTFTIFATWFGAEASIGSAGNVYVEGLTGARIEPIGYTIALIMCALLLGKKLRERSYITLADFFADRFGPRIEKVTVFVLVPSTLAWISAQVLAFGHLLNGVIHISSFWCLVIAVFVVVFYCSFGGFLGSVYTDVIQAFVLIGGMIALLFYAFPYIHQSPWEILHHPGVPLATAQNGVEGSYDSFFSRFDSWAIPILGSMTSQELISRLLAAKTPKIAKWSSIYAAIFYFSLGLIPVYLGLAGTAFPITIKSGDDFLPEVAKFLLPGTFYVIFSAAMISAILSTADSSLITVTGLVTHNLCKTDFFGQTDAQRVWLNRVVLILCGVIIFLLASGTDKIYDLMMLESSLGTAGIFVLIFMGLWTDFGSEKTAFATLATGLLGPMLLEHLNVPAPFAATVVLCFLTYGVFAFLATSSK